MFSSFRTFISTRPDWRVRMVLWFLYGAMRYTAWVVERLFQLVSHLVSSGFHFMLSGGVVAVLAKVSVGLILLGVVLAWAGALQLASVPIQLAAIPGILCGIAIMLRSALKRRRPRRRVR
jgi:hypothetical protein